MPDNLMIQYVKRQEYSDNKNLYKELMADPHAVQIGFNRRNVGLNKHNLVPSNMVFNEPTIINDVNVEGMSVSDVWHQILHGRFFTLTSTEKEGKFYYNKDYGGTKNNPLKKPAMGTYFGSDVVAEIKGDDDEATREAVEERRIHALRALVNIYAKTRTGTARFNTVRRELINIQKETGHAPCLFSTKVDFEDTELPQVIAETLTGENQEKFTKEELNRFFSLDPSIVLGEGHSIGENLPEGLLDDFGRVVSVPGEYYVSLRDFLLNLPPDTSAIVLPDCGRRNKKTKVLEENLRVPYYLRSLNAQTLCKKMNVHFGGSLGLDRDNLSHTVFYNLENGIPGEKPVIDFTSSTASNKLILGVSRAMESAPAEGRIVVARNVDYKVGLDRNDERYGVVEMTVAPIVENLGRGRMAHIFCSDKTKPVAKDATMIKDSINEHYIVENGSYDDVLYTSKGLTVPEALHSKGVFVKRCLTPEEMNDRSRELGETHEYNNGIEPKFIETEVNRQVVEGGRSSERAAMDSADIMLRVTCKKEIGTGNPTVSRMSKAGIKGNYVSCQLKPTKEYLRDDDIRSLIANKLIDRAAGYIRGRNADGNRIDALRLGIIGDDMYEFFMEYAMKNVDDKNGKDREIAAALGSDYGEQTPGELEPDDIEDFLTDVVGRVKAGLEEMDVRLEVSVAGHDGQSVGDAGMVAAQLNGITPNVYLPAANESRQNADTIAVKNNARMDKMPKYTMDMVVTKASGRVAGEAFTDAAGITPGWAYALLAVGYSASDVCHLDAYATSHGILVRNAASLIDDVLTPNEDTVPFPQENNPLFADRLDDFENAYRTIVREYASSGIEMLTPTSPRLPRTLRDAMREGDIRDILFMKGNADLLERPVLSVNIPADSDESHVRELASGLANLRLTVAVNMDDSSLTKLFVEEFTNRGGHLIVSMTNPITQGPGLEEALAVKKRERDALYYQQRPLASIEKALRPILLRKNAIRDYLVAGETSSSVSAIRMIEIARKMRGDKIKVLKDNREFIEESYVRSTVAALDDILGKYMEMCEPYIAPLQEKLAEALGESRMSVIRARNDGSENIDAMLAEAKMVSNVIGRHKPGDKEWNRAGITDDDVRNKAGLDSLVSDLEDIVNGGKIEELTEKDTAAEEMIAHQIEVLDKEIEELEFRIASEKKGNDYSGYEEKVLKAGGLLMSTTPSRITVPAPDLYGLSKEQEKEERRNYNRRRRYCTLPDALQMKEGESPRLEAARLRTDIGEVFVSLDKRSGQNEREKVVHFADVKLAPDNQEEFSLTNRSSMATLEKCVRSFHHDAKKEEERQKELEAEYRPEKTLSEKLNSERFSFEVIHHSGRVYALFDGDIPKKSEPYKALVSKFKDRLEIVNTDDISKTRFLDNLRGGDLYDSDRDRTTIQSPEPYIEKVFYVEENVGGKVEGKVCDINEVPNGMFDLPLRKDREEASRTFDVYKAKFDEMAASFYAVAGWTDGKAWLNLTDASYPYKDSKNKRSIRNFKGETLFSFSYENGGLFVNDGTSTRKIMQDKDSVLESLLSDMKTELFEESRTLQARRERDERSQMDKIFDRQEMEDNDLGPANLSMFNQERMEQHEIEIGETPNVELARREIESAVRNNLLIDLPSAETVDRDAFALVANDLLKADKAKGRQLARLEKALHEVLLNNADVYASGDRMMIQGTYGCICIDRISADLSGRDIAKEAAKLRKEEVKKYAGKFVRKVDEIIKSDPKMSATAIIEKRKAAGSTKTKSDASDGKSRTSQPEKQKHSPSYEVSTKGDVRFSALKAKMPEGSVVCGVDVSGRTIEDVYQNVVKRSRKNAAPAKDSILYIDPSLNLSKEEKEEISYQKGYLPLWQKWAEANEDLLRVLYRKSYGHALTDRFATTQVSQARALTDILAARTKESSRPLLSFTASRQYGYRKRTEENAKAARVDFTLQMAVNFNSPGEILTTKCAGDKNIPVAIPVRDGHIDMSLAEVKNTAQKIYDGLQKMNILDKPLNINLAGNGLYTMNRFCDSQYDIDVFTAAVVMELRNKNVKFGSWRSGGQTGVDEAVAAAAMATGTPALVHGPSDWKFRIPEGLSYKDISNETQYKARFDKNYDYILKDAQDILNGLKYDIGQGRNKKL